MALDADVRDIGQIKDIFVSRGQAASGMSKAVLTFRDAAPGIALFDIARSWWYNQELEGGGTRKWFHSVKWWDRNYREDRPHPAPEYGIAGAPPGVPAPPAPPQHAPHQ